MKLDNDELYALLMEKDIPYLYHANTLSTTITFIEQGGLLSRGEIEKRGLYQSPQGSDYADKLFNVWNDVFLDTTDLHAYFGRQNYYGPILFQFDTSLIRDPALEIWITKDNPKYWTLAMTDTEKYFTSVAELRNNWDLYQRQKKMITIRSSTNPILFGYIFKVIIDDPQLTRDNLTYFRESINALKVSLKGNDPLKNKFILRSCSSCWCISNYREQVKKSDLKRLFLPKP